MPEIKDVIGIVLAVLMIAYLLPTGISALIAANTTEWGTSEAAIWNLLQLIAVVGALVIILKPAMESF
jgi:hypothetical protein